LEGLIIRQLVANIISGVLSGSEVSAKGPEGKTWSSKVVDLFVRLFVCSLVRWFVGSLVRWFVGSLVRWSVGPLVRWSVGPLVRWSVCPFVRLSVCPFVRLFVCSLVRLFVHLSRESGAIFWTKILTCLGAGDIQVFRLFLWLFLR